MVRHARSPSNKAPGAPAWKTKSQSAVSYSNHFGQQLRAGGLRRSATGSNGASASSSWIAIAEDWMGSSSPKSSSRPKKLPLPGFLLHGLGEKSPMTRRTRTSDWLCPSRVLRRADEVQAHKAGRDPPGGRGRRAWPGVSCAGICPATQNSEV